MTEREAALRASYVTLEEVDRKLWDINYSINPYGSASLKKRMSKLINSVGKMRAAVYEEIFKREEND